MSLYNIHNDGCYIYKIPSGIVTFYKNTILVLFE